MKLKLFGILAGLLLAASANASIIYKFDFTDLSNVRGGTGADFSITLTYSTYVTTTGMAPAPGAPLPTSLSYSVNYAGTNNGGQWGFDDDTNSSLTDLGFVFGGNSFEFNPSAGHTGYFTTPGVFPGLVFGNSGPEIGFRGIALLTITDTSLVPEPATLALLGLSLAGLATVRRRKSH